MEKNRRIAAEARRVVIKVGSSLLTEDHRLSEARVGDLAEAVCRLRREGRELILVSSGAIAAGMERLGLDRRPRSVPEKQAAAAVGQSYLMQAYERAFTLRKCQIAQILLTRNEFSFRRRYLNARNTFSVLLERGVIPVVNENDTVAVEEIQVGDNDTLSATVACLTGADVLLILSDVAGLCTSDPACDGGACLIPFIKEVTSAMIEGAGGSRSSTGTGGMQTKLLAAKQVMDFGIPMVIADGRETKTIARVLAGEAVGTIFVPPRRRVSGRKHWIRHSIPPRGAVEVDAGAVRALVEQHRSLLPAGITGVSGEFQAGDAVRILGPDGREVARGLTNYDARDIRQIKGLRTDQARLVLGYVYDEAVHRDDLVTMKKGS